MLEIRPLTPADLPAAMRLSTQAGWNQLDADWRRLLDLWPETCLAGWDAGQLVATGTIAAYGQQIGWLGMVLVDEACRGRGFGGAIFDAIIHLAAGRRLACLGLDATDLGRPIYLKRGFADVIGIHRWLRLPGDMPPISKRESAPVTTLNEVTPAIAAWDAQACGVGRGPLLAHLVTEPGVVARVLRDHTQSIRAAVFCRPGRTASHIGPIVAESADAAAELVESILRTPVPAPFASHRVFVDALAEPAFEKLLAKLGFTKQRVLTRMTRPAVSPSPLTGPRAFAATGFELG